MKSQVVLVTFALLAAILVPAAVGYASRARTGVGVSVEVIDSLKSQASTEQKAAFSDGVIDDPEYDAAITRTIQCLTDAGIPVHPVSGGKRSEFTYGDTSSPEEQRKVSAVYSDCYNRYQRQIDIAKAQQDRRVLSPAESALASTDVITCLRDQGVAVPADASKAVWYETRLSSPVEFGRCADSIVAKYGALP